MTRTIISGIALSMLLGTAGAQEAVAPALYVKADDIASALERALGERPAMGVSTITTTDQYRINLITRTEAAGAIVHRPGTELHFITSGAGVLVTGGTVLRPAEGRQGNIENGVAQRVSSGDAILIPEGTPHQYTVIEGSLTYLEVRFNVPISPTAP